MLEFRRLVLVVVGVAGVDAALHAGVLARAPAVADGAADAEILDVAPPAAATPHELHGDVEHARRPMAPWRADLAPQLGERPSIVVRATAKSVVSRRQRTGATLVKIARCQRSRKRSTRRGPGRGSPD